MGSGGATDTRRLSALRQRWHDIAAWCVGGSGAAAHACARRSGLRGTEIELERRHLPAGEGVFEHHVHPLTILCTMGVVFWSLAASWARASVAPSRGMRGTNVQRGNRQTDERSFCWCSWWAGSSPRSPHGQKKRRGVGLRRQRAGRPESAPRLIVMSVRGRATVRAHAAAPGDGGRRGASRHERHDARGVSPRITAARVNRAVV